MAGNADQVRQVAGLTGHDAREAFLGRVSEGYNHGRMPARLGRFVTPALAAAFPPPEAIPAFPVVTLDQRTWRSLVEYTLPMDLPIRSHPLEGHLLNSLYFLDHFLVPVVLGLNGRTRPRCFLIHGRLPINLNQQAQGPQTPRIRVVGRVAMFITRDDAPCCLIHLARAGTSMDEAASRALLFAAAQGHRGNQSPLLAVATDLARWRFFLVKADGFTQLPERRVTFLPSGSPVLEELSSALEELASLIAHAV